MILAQYNHIPVSITGTIRTGDNRIKAIVHAVTGTPFTQTTHGGPVDTDTAIVSPDALADVRQVKAQPAQPMRRSRTPGYKPELAYVDLEDAGAVFPVRMRTPQPGRCTINSD